MMKKKFGVQRFLIINIGIIILAIGLYFFLIPADLAVGGVTGLAMVINKVFPIFRVGTIMFISNALLLALAFIILGREFTGYTIYTSLVLSGLIDILDIMIPLQGPPVDDIILNLIFGIGIQGIGMAIILNKGTSTGGTDISAKIINKYTHFPIGTSLLMSDVLIVMFSIFAFGLEKSLYAFMGITLNSLIIDKFIAGFNTRIKVMIISDKEVEISRYIIYEVKRGVTFLYGAGGFSNADKRIINTVVSRKEYMKIKNHVREIDPHAFMWINFVNEVLGEGFSI